MPDRVPARSHFGARQPREQVTAQREVILD
jgi:hypothetical protein